jgi:capsule polysaccharide export protein KpsE/RkpR
MEATIEAPTMTLKEAEALIATWQTSLQDAQNALAHHEQQLGQIALASGAEAATQALMRLQVEVRMAEAGVAAANAQRETVRRAKQAERAVNLRAEAAELNTKLHEDAAFLEEWGQKVAAARNRLEQGSRQHSQMIAMADEIEWRLKEARGHER